MTDGKQDDQSTLTRIVAPIAALVRRGNTEPAEGEERPAGDSSTRESRPASVLIVDDEADVRLTLRTVLRRSTRLEIAGEAVDGQEALDQIRAQAPDIVLLDLMMPRLDGRQAAPLIFTESPNTMIVVLSALSAADEATGVLANGAFAYVEKSELGPKLADGLEALWDRFCRALDGEDVWAPTFTAPFYTQQ